MKKLVRAVAAAALTVATATATMITTAPPAEAASCYAVAGGKTNCYVWTGYNYTYQSPNTFLLKGYMNTGWSYFYCQSPGASYSDHGYTNKWWLKTDDDAGNRGVWLSAVYVSSGSNNQPIPGVRRC